MAPDLLRADSPENIYLEAGNLRGRPTVSISIKDFTRSLLLYSDEFEMDYDQGGHTLRSIQVRRLNYLLGNKMTFYECSVFIPNRK